MRFRTAPRRLLALAALPLAAAGCDLGEATVPQLPLESSLVVLNSTGRTLSVLSFTDLAPRTFSLGAAGTPVSLAAAGPYVVVPMGIANSVAIVNLHAGTVNPPVDLGPGSGATGAAFLNDSLVIVANPGRNTVTPVNVKRGTALPEIPVGVYPHHVIAGGGRAYVLNANLGPDFLPAGKGSLTVLGSNLSVVRTVELSGRNPGAAAFRGGRLWVVNSDAWGANASSLSEVDINSLQEVRHVTGFGDYAGSITANPVGSIFVGVHGKGVLAYDPGIGFVRDLTAPLKLGEYVDVAGLLSDGSGRLYALSSGDCATQNGQLYQLNESDGAVRNRITLGVCPWALDVTTYER